MNSQLYTAASGLQVQQRRLEMVTNNLANVSTGAFQAQRPFSTIYQGLAEAGELPANKSVAVAGSYAVPGTGPLRSTGRPLDVALKEGDLLVVETEAGRRYLRDGSLGVSADAELIDSRGNPVLDPRGRRIAGLTPATKIEVDGRVVDGDAELARLLVVRDPQGVLRVEGDNLRTADGRDDDLEDVAAPVLRPASLEGSATNALQELVELVDAQRAFETYQKLISMTMNEVNRKAVNDIAG